MKKILLVEDDIALSAGLCFELEEEDYLTVAAYSLKKAGQLLETSKFDLLLLDVDLPDGNGFTFYKEIKKRYTVPVMFLTGRKEEEDVLGGYDLGADDYVTKPFNPMEVVARVKSQLRRYTRLGSIKQEEENTITIGGVTLNDKRKSVFVDGDPVTLTPTEYSILRLLMSNPNQVFSSAQIYAAVWKEAAYGSDSTVAVHIRHLRGKIEIEPADPRYIKVVWGQGYKFESGGKQI